MRTTLIGFLATFLPTALLCLLLAPADASQRSWRPPIDVATAPHEPGALLDGTPAPVLACARPAVAAEPEASSASPNWITEEDSPPDPVQRGSGSVRIVLRDDVTDEVVTSKIQLWRLAAPGNEHWRAGDQRQAQGQAGDIFEGLPVGRYRVHVLGQRTGSEDPPAFVVRGLHAVQTLRVPMPRSFPVRLELYDEDGARIRRARLSSNRGMPRGRSDSTPTWRTARKLRSGAHVFRSFGGWGMGGGHRRGTLWTDADEAGQFTLADIDEPTRVSHEPVRHVVRLDGHNRVDVELEFQAPGTHVLRGVLLPIGPIHDAVLMPDGTRAIDHGAKFDIRSRAVLAKAGDAFRPRDVPVHVTVTLLGHDELKFVVRAGVEIAPIPLRARY